MLRLFTKYIEEPVADLKKSGYNRFQLTMSKEIYKDWFSFQKPYIIKRNGTFIKINGERVYIKIDNSIRDWFIKGERR